jgi:UDP-N-acetyl-D-mannosaminuronic acid dehydrogenase
VNPKVLFKTTMQIRPEEFLPADELVRRCDLVVLGVPHKEYRTLDLQGKPVVDVWNFLGRGGVVAPAG